MGSDPHDATPCARAGALFPVFAEEVDPEFRPLHAAAVAVGKLAFPADAGFESGEQVVETLRVGEAVSHEDTFSPRIPE